MKRLKFPTAIGMLAWLTLVVGVGIRFIPSGSFNRLIYETKTGVFQLEHATGVDDLPGTQATLDSLGVRIPVATFQQGNITKPVAVPGSYYAQPKPDFHWTALFLVPIHGLHQASDVIFFVLIIGGFIGVVQKTGAIDHALRLMSEKIAGRSYWLIVAITACAALGGTTFGMAEELIAFVPILVPVFAAAGYNSLVAMSSLFLGSAVGMAMALSNPFSTIIASDAAGINWVVGSGKRAALLGIALVCTMAYLIWYGHKSRIPVDASAFAPNRTAAMGWRKATILLVFASSFIALVTGVALLDWWFAEMTAVFLAAALLVGFLAPLSERSWLQIFLAGAADMLSVALIIGMARGISVLMENQLVSDTILNVASHWVQGYHGPFLLLMLMVVFALMSFFVPSSSGLAVLTMPLFAPLADGIPVSRSAVVDAYLFGQGMFHILNPTSLVLMFLSAAQVSYKAFFNMVWPLVFLLFLMLAVSLFF